MKRNTTATPGSSPPKNGGKSPRPNSPAVLVSHLTNDSSAPQSLGSSTRRTDLNAADYGRRNQRTENRRRPGSRFTPLHASIVRQAVRTLKPDVSRERQDQIADKITVKVRDVMDEAGLDDRALVTRFLAPALDAHETRFFPMPDDSDPTRIVTRQTVAWGTRTRALDMAFNLRGSYAPRAAQVELSGTVSLADAVREARQRVVDVVAVAVEAGVDPQTEAQLTNQT